MGKVGWIQVQNPVDGNQPFVILDERLVQISAFISYSVELGYGPAVDTISVHRRVCARVTSAVKARNASITPRRFQRDSR